jgi:alpha-L-rhamnosidase
MRKEQHQYMITAVNGCLIRLALTRKTPRLSRKTYDAKQTAYQMFVDEDSLKVTSVGSSKKISNTSEKITYPGKALELFTKYYWKFNSSAVAYFETGMIEMKIWKGSWISDSKDINLKFSVYFRKAFAINKRIHSARVYFAVAGLYELYLNEKRIGNHVLDPMYTRFDRITLYVNYDVTKDLRESRKALGYWPPMAGTTCSQPRLGILTKRLGGQNVLSGWIRRLNGKLSLAGATKKGDS